MPLGLVTLVGLRDVLRKRNLYDTSDEPAVNLPAVAPATPGVRTTRTVDGTYNDLDEPRMGMAGFRFGRDVPIDRTYADPPSEFMQPSPREVSRALLTRDQLIPATSANALVATWLQFMIRDWFSHGTSPTDIPGTCRSPTTTRGRPGRCGHADPGRPDRPARGASPADPRQHHDPLVGRVPDLRTTARPSSSSGPARTASCDWTDGLPPFPMIRPTIRPWYRGSGSASG